MALRALESWPREPNCSFCFQPQRGTTRCDSLRGTGRLSGRWQQVLRPGLSWALGTSHQANKAMHRQALPRSRCLQVESPRKWTESLGGRAGTRTELTQILVSFPLGELNHGVQGHPLNNSNQREGLATHTSRILTRSLNGLWD